MFSGCSYQLLRDGRMPFVGRDEEGRVPVLILKINVTASFNQGQLRGMLLSNIKKPLD